MKLLIWIRLNDFCQLGFFYYLTAIIDALVFYFLETTIISILSNDLHINVLNGVLFVKDIEKNCNCLGLFITFII